MTGSDEQWFDLEYARLTWSLAKRSMPSMISLSSSGRRSLASGDSRNAATSFSTPHNLSGSFPLQDSYTLCNTAMPA